MTHQPLIRRLSSAAVVLCIALSLTACVKKTYYDETASIAPPVIQRAIFGTAFEPRDQPALADSTQKTPPLARRLREPQQLRRNQSSLDDNTNNRSDALTAAIAGNWDDVTGWISFPYDDGNDELYVLVRGLEGIKQTGDEYSFSGWDGDVFWIDMGDGVPRLLPAKMINSAFTPQATDTFTQSGKLYEAGYILYRQAGVNYPANEWENEAVLGDLLFVTDADDQVLEIVVDVYQDDGTFVESRMLGALDQIQLFTHAYNLNEPDAIYLMEYMDPKVLKGQPSIEKSHYVPNVDFADSELLSKAGGQFDANALKLELLVDAVRVNNQGNFEFAFNTPQELGYTWGEAKQALSTNTTTSSNGGGSFNWILLLLAGLGSYRLVKHRQQ